MPQLLKNIQGSIVENIMGDINYVIGVSGEIQREDYINLNGFVAYLQNFTRVMSLTEMQVPSEFGLKNTYNVEINTLEISY
jgi:hypothetical protein